MNSKVELERAIRTDRTAALVVNIRSRRGEALFHQAKEQLISHGFTLTIAVRAQDSQTLFSAVRHAISCGEKLVVLGGGDGTISSLVGEFACRDVVLGILPCGTGNSFAQSLGIPLDLHNAVEVIAHGKVVDVDLGKVNDRYFSNIVSIGISAAIAMRTSANLKRLLGKIAYVWVGAQEIWRHRPFHCVITTDRGREVIDSYEMMVANGNIYGDTVVTDEASVENRRLTLFITTMRSRWELLAFWVAFLLGRHTALPTIRHCEVREAHIETDPPQYLDIDGEFSICTPATFNVAPQALRVFAPYAFIDT